MTDTQSRFAFLNPRSHFQSLPKVSRYPFRGISIGKQVSPLRSKPRSHSQPVVSDESNKYALCDKYAFCGTFTATHSLPDARKPRSQFHPRPWNENVSVKYPFFGTITEIQPAPVFR